MIEITIDMGQVTDWLNVGLTGSIVFFTLLNILIMRRLRWLTGAMERHSDQQRQLAARNAIPPIEMIWWDKTIGGPFPHEGEHLDPNQLGRMYIGVPEIYRRYRGWRRIKKWWRQYKGMPL